MARLVFQYVQTLVNLLTIAIIARAVLSWFPISPYNPVVMLLNRITEPLIAPLRRIIPRAGVLDLTPLIAILLLQAIANLLAYLLP